MIPEFITAKPATNLNASEAPSVAAEHFADQLLSKDAFQKALQEQTSEPQAEQQTSRSGDRRSVSAADETRSEPPRRLTPERASTDTDKRSSVQEPSRTAANEPPAGRNDAAESSATDAARTDDTSVTSRESPGGVTDSPLQSAESSNLIRRIDPANHSTSDNAPSTSADGQVGEELPSQTPDTALPQFVSSDDLDLATLPSLIRLPLDDVSISQFPGDLVPKNASAVDGDLRELPTSQLPSEIDGDLRPFLNDALIPDSGLPESSDRFTATDPSLITDVVKHPSAARINSPIPNEELLSIPTLPSLRPDTPGTSQISANADGLTPAVVGELVNEGLTDVGHVVSADPSSGAATVLENSSPKSVPVELEAQLRTDVLRPGAEQESEGLALVLPSLTSGPKQVREPSRVADDRASSGKLADARNSGVVLQAVDAGSAAIDSIVDVSGASKTESEPDVLRNAVGGARRSSDSASTTAAPEVVRSAGLSQNAVAGSPNVPSVDDGVTVGEKVRPEPDEASRVSVTSGTNVSPANSESEPQPV
jgi:hypothetical protein